MKGGAHSSPFAALSFPNSKNVPIFCWVDRQFSSRRMAKPSLELTRYGDFLRHNRAALTTPPRRLIITWDKCSLHFIPSNRLVLFSEALDPKAANTFINKIQYTKIVSQKKKSMSEIKYIKAGGCSLPPPHLPNSGGWGEEAPDIKSGWSATRIPGPLPLSRYALFPFLD